MFKIRNVAKLLLATGAVMVSLHTAVVTFGSCIEKNQCLANVYFGVPESASIPLMADVNESANSTESIVTSTSLFTTEIFFMVMQITGLYAIMIGITGLLLFEIHKLLKLFSRTKRRSHS